MSRYLPIPPVIHAAAELQRIARRVRRYRFRTNANRELQAALCAELRAAAQRLLDPPQEIEVLRA